MELSFINKDTKKKITLYSDKKLIAIYGKNGTGKTTFSRISEFEKKYVFNDDFIYSNVYNASDKGFSQSATTKENFSGLWLGENIVSLRLEISKIQELEKIILQKNIDLKNYIISNIAPIGIVLDYDTYIKNLKYNDFTLENNIEEAFQQYQIQNTITSCIKDNNELNEKINYYKNNNVFNDLILKIKQSKILSIILLKENNNEIEYINQKLDILYKNKELISETEKIFKEEEISESLKSKINEWYVIHENKNKCIFCGNPNINESLKKWKKIFKNDFIIEKKELYNNIKSEINICESIIKEDLYNKIDMDIIRYIKEIINILKSKINDIENNIFEKLIININPKEIKTIEINNLSNEITNYLINKNLKEIEFYYNAKLYITNMKKTKTEELDKLMDLEGDKIANNINSIFKKIGLNKNISITVDKHSTPHKFTYKIKNHNDISELSDGQKHKLALAIFINSIIDTDLTNKTIVIDDPVVALDISSYILFKQLLVSDLISKFSEETKLIILTHDITYLYIQLSNIFDNEKMKEITEVFKLSGDKIEKIPLDYIKTDDISLFKLALSKCKNVSELKVLNVLTLKIFRIIIDIRLRFYGISDTSEVGVKLLKLNEENKQLLQKYSNHLSKVAREHTPKLSDILISFKYLKETTKLLGINDYITDEDIFNIENIIKNNIDEQIEDELFIMIKEISDFLKKSTNKEMKGYVEHTRVSYTRNLIGLSLDDYFE